MKAISLFIIAAVAILPADAQDAVPQSPLLHRAPSFASWTITYQYHGSPPLGATDQVSSLTVTKTGKTYREQYAWKSGLKTESWIYQNVYLRTTSDGKSIVPLPLPLLPSSPGGAPSDIFDYSKSDFEGLHWLDLASYLGQEAYGGQKAFHFKGKTTQAPPGSLAPPPAQEAYLIIVSQLPLYSNDESVERTYTYNQPPTVALVPPAQYLDIIQKMHEGQEYRRSRPSPP